jgi:hypothetical protein
MDSKMDRVRDDAVTIIAFQLDGEENENETSSGILAEAQDSYFLNASS